MKKYSYLTTLIILLSSCGVIMQPIATSINDSLENIDQEMENDSCEQTLISLIMLKRFSEHMFPDNLEQLDWVDTTQFTELEHNEYRGGITPDINKYISRWSSHCKYVFDTITMHPYSVDSLKIDWTKIVEFEKSTKKVIKESWMLNVKSDSIFEQNFLDLKIEVIDSKGNVISKITGKAKRDD
jgi:hypothetical protein